MGTEASLLRYRTWYAALVRLYPPSFHAQFGEGLKQTFHDLCRERANARRGLAGFALWIYCETLVEIIRENTIAMTEMNKTILRAALGALALLMVPIAASQVVEGWNWELKGFVLTYVLFFGTGMAFALISRKMGAWSYKAGVGLALAAGFVLGWASMVHMSETENQLNLLYIGVLVAGGIGVWHARLQPRGLARVALGMAAALAVIALAAMLTWDVPERPGGNQSGLRGVCALLFATAGLLFRRASLAETK